MMVRFEFLGWQTWGKANSKMVCMLVLRFCQVEEGEAEHRREHEHLDSHFPKKLAIFANSYKQMLQYPPRLIVAPGTKAFNRPISQ